MEIALSVERIVMQPTSLCNLNCSYCYLPDRAKNAPMLPAVAEAVAGGIARLGNSVELIWHAGEPLSCGPTHFSKLIAPFEELRAHDLVSHAIQTNATLIDEQWCEVFLEKEFRVGVSLDGPSWANARRVGWTGQPAFEKIMRGIAHLTTAKIPFHVICVVNQKHLDRASELYGFFADIGCTSVGFNIEERLGVYEPTCSDSEAAVVAFWRTLFRSWQERPVIKVREFARMLPSLTALIHNELSPPRCYDAFPSVAYDGGVVLLAPEFLNTRALRYDNFVVGNVLVDDLATIVERGRQSLYVEDFRKGVSRCRSECEYFSTCYGGQPGNKFFELGTLDGTETTFCRNSEKRLADAILCELASQREKGVSSDVVA